MTVNEMRAGASKQSPPATAIIESIVGAYTAQAICVIARLGVADALANGPRSVEVIARQVGADDSALYRVLRAVGDAGVVAELDDRRFVLTPLGEVLRSDVPGSLRAWATLIGMPFWQRPWSELNEAVRTGETQFGRVNGMRFFDYLVENPDDADVFNAGFTSMYTSRNIIGGYDLTRFGTIVDIGGGTGIVLAEILSTNPHLRGVLFDTPTAVAGAEAELSKAGVADRCQVVSGDVHDSVPTGGDVYLLSGVIHGSSDDQAVEILSTCRAAMADTACLLIAETVLPDDSRPSIGKVMDLQMLIFTDKGRFRTEAEFRSLLQRADFRTVRIVPSSDMVSLVEAVPNSSKTS
ncbi:MAG: hydroxyneurosporene methyltransferase [Pseudonocardiales bacterium]|nr:MAG: hydroxyneurosporene methyltransferase [Pseudonocardiales bacterium]